MLESYDHHIKEDVCLTRPPYRNGKKHRAVKVYTIAQESKYLLIQNIPSIAGVADQLLPHFSQYGPIEQSWKLDGYVRKDPTADDQFLDTMLIKYVQIPHARVAKRLLDDMNFMGSNLHVCYAPECETVDDLKEKIDERRSIVQRKSELNRFSRGKARSTNKSRMSVLSNDPFSATTRAASSAQRTADEIRTQMREIVQKSNLVPLVLQQELRQKRKRLQI